MERFGDYWLEERLDRGGEFAFFRASRAPAAPEASREECVVLRVTLATAESTWPPWADPGIAKRLGPHRTIVRMLDDAAIEDHRCFTFEHVDGVDLRHLLRKAPLPREIALHVSRAVVEALSVANATADSEGRPLELSHGSLDPRWVMISREGDVRLGGFGLGAVKPERRGEPPSAERLVEVAAAPEQLSGQQVEPTPLTNIFQVGLLLHRMLYGSPFVSGTLARIVEHLGGPPLEATRLRGEGAPLDEVLRGLLAERPEDRFASLRHVRRAIDEVILLAGSERARRGEHPYREPERLDAPGWLARRVAQRSGERTRDR